MSRDDLGDCMLASGRGPESATCWLTEQFGNLLCEEWSVGCVCQAGGRFQETSVEYYRRGALHPGDLSQDEHDVRDESETLNTSAAPPHASLTCPRPATRTKKTSAASWHRPRLPPPSPPRRRLRARYASYDCDYEKHIIWLRRYTSAGKCVLDASTKRDSLGFSTIRLFTASIHVQIGVRNALGAAEIGRVLKAFWRVWGRNDGNLTGGWQESWCLIASWERERSGLEGWFWGGWTSTRGCTQEYPVIDQVTRESAHTAPRIEQHAVAEDATGQTAAFVACCYKGVVIVAAL